MNYSKFEIIEWLDHCAYSDSQWRSKDEVEELVPIKILTLGFIIQEDKDCIKVVSSAGNEDHLGGDLLILKKVILRRKEISNPWKDWSK